MCSCGNSGRWHKPIARATRLAVLAGLSCLVLAQNAAGFEAIRFKASSKYKAKPVTLRGELFRPKGGGPFPAVVLMHGCGGWQGSVHKALQEHARYLVRHGFVVLNLDSFGPRAIPRGWVCKAPRRAGAARSYRQADAYDAMSYLRARPYVDAQNIFHMGQSNGGSVAVHLAQAQSMLLHGERVLGKRGEPFRATAAFYPWCGAFDKWNGVKLISPLIAFVGDRDDWLLPGGCKTVTATGKPYKVVAYPLAAHSFDLRIKPQRYLGYRVGWNAAAAADSRKQMVAFFRQHMTPKLRSTMPMSVLEAQTVLKALGHDPGPLDGAWGGKTLAALNALRREHGLKPVDRLDADSAALLRKLR